MTEELIKDISITLSSINEIISRSPALISNDLDKINNSLILIGNNIQEYQFQLTNQPWFQFIIGSVVTLFATTMYEYASSRRKRLKEIYDFFVVQHAFYEPIDLFKKGRMTSYASTTHKDGQTIKNPEKPMGEKMLIEFREHIKWWRYPKGRLWYLLRKYDHAISNIPDISDEKTIKETKEYKKAQKVFDKLRDHIYRATGENQWTA